MTRTDEFDYYVRRAQDSRRMAERTCDPAAQRSHLELARRYRAIADRLESPLLVN